MIREIIIALFIFFHIHCIAQDSKTPAAAWWFPGISYQASPAVRLLGQWGTYNHHQRRSAVYTQAFIRINKHLTLNPAYLYLSAAGNQLQKEHTMMNAVILKIFIHKIVLEDRNLLWNRWRAGEDFHMYRNRLRATFPFKIGSADSRVYVFDECTYFFNRGRWSRNRLAIGCAYNITPWFDTDIFYARQNDVYSGNLNLFFIQGTVLFSRKSEVGRKKQEVKKKPVY